MHLTPGGILSNAPGFHFKMAGLFQAVALAVKLFGDSYCAFTIDANFVVPKTAFPKFNISLSSVGLDFDE